MRKHWFTALCCAGIGLGLLANSTAARTRSAAWQGRPGESKALIATRLHSLFEMRTQDGCEITAPIQAEIKLLGDAGLGLTIPVQFNVITTESGPNGTVTFAPSKGMEFTGQRVQKGTFMAGQVYSFSGSIRIDRPGDYEIAVGATAGTPEYQFGQRYHLYFRASASGIQVSDRKFDDVVDARSNLDSPKRLGALDGPIFSDLATSTLHPVKAEEFEGDLNGFGANASASVSGTWRYRGDDGSLHAGYGTTVYLWDEDTLSADDLLGGAVVAGDGTWLVNFDNNSDGGLEPGTADVYIEFNTANGAASVINGSDNKYVTKTSVQYTNIGGGAHPNENWLADWGVSGTADNNERAWQVLDYISRAWEYSNYTLGHDTHFTAAYWYAGSPFTGSYYLTGDNKLRIEEIDFLSPDVVYHEYGHSQHDSIFSDSDWPPGTGGSHSWTGHYTTGLAYTEGFATFFGLSAQSDHQWYDSYDPDNQLHIDCDANYDGNGSANGNSDGLSTGANSGFNTESAVCCFLLDIFDSRNSTTDPYDWITDGGDEIFDVMRNYTTGGHKPYNIQEVYDGWKSRGHGSVPKINGQMFVHGMDQGVSNPPLGLYSGVSTYTGTWYWGGYGRGSFDAKNYSSRSYDINQLFVWVQDPEGDTIYGGFGGDGDTTAFTSGEVRNIYKTTDHLNQSDINNAGVYTVKAGFYRSDNTYMSLQPAESGVDNNVSKTVVLDTDTPDYCTVVDDGVIANSSAQLHFVATADDYDSGIKGYYTRVGTTAGSGNEQDWVWHDAAFDTSFDYTITGLTMAPNTTYYITVVARNFGNYDKYGYSNGIISYDATPPTNVSVTDDGATTTVLNELHWTAFGTENDGVIESYWYKIRDEFGATIVPYTEVVTGDVNTWEFTKTGLALVNGRTYYIDIAVKNSANLYGYGSSNGIKALVGKPLSGKIKPQDITNLSGRKAYIWIGANTMGGSLYQGQYVTLDAAGNYAMDSSNFGNVRVLCWFPKHLWQAKFVNISNVTGLSGVNFSQINGDVDGDNVIGLFDYLRLSAAFDAVPGDANWDASADLDEDNVISLFDYLILSANFDREGDY